VNACAFCGRDNLADARFCIDCGKPLRLAAAAQPLMSPTAPAFPASAPAASPAMASVIPMTRVETYTSGDANRCPQCGVPAEPGQTFCTGCGRQLAAEAPRNACSRCGADYDPGTDLYCSRCGASLPTRGTGPFGTTAEPLVVLAVVGESGEVLATHEVFEPETSLGREEAALRFPDDVYMSPLHARLELREGQLYVRDLGSRNGTWAFIDGPTCLGDGDLVLVGSQVLRFRRLGYPGPRPPEADATRRIGSLVPSADVAVLEQLRADGSVRDRLHLSPGRTVGIGREVGDWVFPYDQTMSGRHAEVRAEGADFFARDLGSRNGVAIAVRGERPVGVSQRFLIGDQVLRVERL